MIFYFSATGNTLWAARQISQATGEQLVPITDDTHPVNITLSEGELLGFCFPVHCWRPPLIVRRFISRLVVENLSQHYVFALCTAGDTVGEAIDIFRNDLSQRSIPLHAVGSLLRPNVCKASLPTLCSIAPSPRPSTLVAGPASTVGLSARCLSSGSSPTTPSVSTPTAAFVVAVAPPFVLFMISRLSLAICLSGNIMVVASPVSAATTIVPPMPFLSDGAPRVKGSIFLKLTSRRTDKLQVATL